MTKWILVLVAAVAISIPSLAQDKDKDKDKDKSNTGESSERSSQKSMSKSGGAAEQQIKAIDEQGREAALKGDTGYLEKYLADNYIAIGGNGQEMTKDQVIQSRKDGKVKYEAIDIKDTKVRTFGNTAIVEHEAHVKGTGPTGPFDGNYRATFVYVKQGNGWKLASFQSTPEQGTQAATNK